MAGTVTETEAGFSIQPYAKTSHSRATIAFGSDLADTLRAHRKAQTAHRLALGPAWDDNDLVVCGLGGQVLRPSKVSARFTPIIRLMEEDGTLSTVGATFHTTRHTHATLLLKAGVPVHVVSKRLRHSKVQITLDYYAHVLPGDDEAVADGRSAQRTVRARYVTHALPTRSGFRGGSRFSLTAFPQVDTWRRRPDSNRG